MRPPLIAVVIGWEASPTVSDCSAVVFPTASPNVTLRPAAAATKLRANGLPAGELTVLPQIRSAGSRLGPLPAGGAKVDRLKAVAVLSVTVPLIVTVVWAGVIELVLIWIVWPGWLKLTGAP